MKNAQDIIGVKVHVINKKTGKKEVLMDVGETFGVFTDPKKYEYIESEYIYRSQRVEE